MTRLGWAAALFVGVVGAGLLRTSMSRQASPATVATSPATPDAVATWAAPPSAIQAAPTTPVTPAGTPLVLWLILAVGVLVLTALVVLVASTVRRQRDPVGIAASPAPASRWHCILEAHTPGGRVVLRRGPVEWAADNPHQVEREIVDRYIATYGPPPRGTRYHCSAAPMASA